MVLRSPAWQQAFLAQTRSRTTCKRWAGSVPKAAQGASDAAAPARKSGTGRPPAKEDKGGSAGSAGSGRPVDLTSLYTSISRKEKHKKSQERDFLVSVLSSSPTKRDAKNYLQTFGHGKGSKALAAVPARSLGRPHTEEQDVPLPVPSAAGGTYYTAGSIRAVSESPQFVQGPRAAKAQPAVDDQPHVAVVKLQDPDTLDDETLAGLAKTFVQLRALGLISVIVIGRTQSTAGNLSGHSQHSGRGWFDYVTHETLRVAAAIDKYGEPVTSIANFAVTWDDAKSERALQHERLQDAGFAPGRIYVDREDALLGPLRKGDIIIVPPYATSTTTSEAKLIDADESVLALTRYFAGFQARTTTEPTQVEGESARPGAIALVDRIIIIDPIGGTPSERRPNGAHVFINLEDEYAKTRAALDEAVVPPLPSGSNGEMLPGEAAKASAAIRNRHKANLDIVRNALALLPSSSSALVTTPAEAANLAAPERAVTGGDADDGLTSFVGSVGTRRSQNPLIHNLLTDRPVYSSSLPLGRIQPKAGRGNNSNNSSNNNSNTNYYVSGRDEAVNSSADDTEPLFSLPRTTLLKRGMPLTIYPDPRVQPWTPPAPGAPRLRLTDTCIDLPRLVHLIEDSFNRPLDVADYLRRVEHSLAGVIVAGAYEGGAILTWERPPGLDEATAYATGRLVPYLDKFAVRKRSQGAGGVADIVFTAMVRDCFPAGVCWRSRKDNPVNRWYFERSRGSWKLGGVNWTMFWTTPWAAVGEAGIWDYASVCRSVAPSWADQKHILD
ncbi:acetylglutamate synthase [Niveomyces insectorum RCEF 264]|uniref:Amino-acid acetyltransferase, mitochondrial n=1 Tax=Niveomyces insectorum RCEF 264 TaxID=1081102 RepID=A0A162J1S8_9HYPO|nr:acetylglutamate synthase [Niveomyces insectorum RCEF 264]